jgi:hypothetical protein
MILASGNERISLKPTGSHWKNPATSPAVIFGPIGNVDDDFIIAKLYLAFGPNQCPADPVKRESF